MNVKCQNSLVIVVFILLLLGLLVGLAWPAPYIVCDPQSGVQYYKVSGASWVPTGNVPAQADGSIKMDIATAPVGTSNLSFVACKTTAEWGEVCSTATPFSFTRPQSPTAPTGLKLAP